MQGIFPELSSLDSVDFARIAVKKPALLIAMTARTGSTWLCAELEAACSVGKVTEVFNPRGPLQHSGCWHKGMAFVDYVSCLAAKISGDTFAFKATWDDFAPIAPHALALLPDLRIAFVQRHSIEAQALSLYYARKTGEWHLRHGESRKPNKPARLDILEIDSIIGHLQRETRSWQSFFASNGLIPEQIYYEEFRYDVADAVARLARLAGTPVSEGKSRPATFQKIGDDDDPWLLEVVRHRRSLRVD